MNELIELAHAKINLTLDVLYRRPDGFHEVEMVMQSVDLADKVRLTRVKQDISIRVSGGEAPSNQSNLAWLAAHLVLQKFQLPGGLLIELEKNIPVAAGMAGGSADAAAVIRGVNRLWQLGLSLEQMFELGAQIGSDVPFCIREGTALAKGRGEILTSLPTCPQLWLVLVNPRVGVSTAQVYSRFKAEKVQEKPDTSEMIKGLAQGDGKLIASALCNVLEPITSGILPEIQTIKQALLQAGALNAMMSGSGPTVFGLARDEIHARNLARVMEGKGHLVLVTKTYG